MQKTGFPVCKTFEKCDFRGVKFPKVCCYRPETDDVFVLLLGLDSVKHHSFASLMMHLGLLAWLGLSIFGGKKSQKIPRNTDGPMKVTLVQDDSMLILETR